MNIDETWLNDTYQARRKWKVNGTTNSMNEKIVQPRISLIAALDTEGDVYLSLTQVNTDTSVMRLYFSKLAM